MVYLVDPSVIEQRVGVRRHASEHWGRANTVERCIDVLHSQKCVDRSLVLGETLTSCLYTYALEEFDPDLWVGFMDKPVRLAVDRLGRLVPDP